MIKRLAVLVVAAVVMVGVASYAVEEPYIYTGFQLYTGVLNLCEGNSGKVLMFDIEFRDGEGEPYLTGERMQLSTDNLLYSAEGVRLTPVECNEGYLDSEVCFLAGRNGYGIKVIFIRML